MGRDTITRIRVWGMRCLLDAELHLDGLAVLIGENGSGKSTLVEAFEILRRTTSSSFIEELYGIHGGPTQLFRQGADRLIFGAVIAGDGGPGLNYRLSVVRNGLDLRIDDESIRELSGEVVFDLALERAMAARSGSVDRGLSVLSQTSRDEDPRIDRVRRVFAAIEVHVPFDTSASWVARAANRPSVLRSTQVLRPTFRLDRLGSNLASAYSALKNDFGQAHWVDTMEYVRLGLGPELESVDIAVDPGGNGAAIKIKYLGLDGHVPAASLSDGDARFSRDRRHVSSRRRPVGARPR